MKSDAVSCDLNEGVMPYRPRHICPDYELLFQKGCKFLALDPPKDYTLSSTVTRSPALASPSFRTIAKIPSRGMTQSPA